MVRSPAVLTPSVLRDRQPGEPRSCPILRPRIKQKQTPAPISALIQGVIPLPSVLNLRCKGALERLYEREQNEARQAAIGMVQKNRAGGVVSAHDCGNLNLQPVPTKQRGFWQANTALGILPVRENLHLAASGNARLVRGSARRCPPSWMGGFFILSGRLLSQNRVAKKRAASLRAQKNRHQRRLPMSVQSCSLYWTSLGPAATSIRSKGSRWR